jgi:hypothetical protein
MRVAPTVSGNESSIGFYRNSDRSTPFAGDVWVLGHAAHGVGIGNFSIGTNIVGRCLSLSADKSATFDGQVVARGSGIAGTIRAAPATNGGESSIGFYRNSDQSGNAAGDQWVLDQGSWGVGAGNFSIGTLARGQCLTIDATTGIVNSFYMLTIAGQPAATRPWVAGRFSGTTVAGAVTLRANIGQQQSVTITRTSTVGEYNLSWTTAHPLGANYVMTVALPGGNPIWLTTSATTATISCYTFQGTQIDPASPADVYFVVY